MAEQTRALQGNAADPKQVRHAARVERDRSDRWRVNLAAVMATGPGRAVMWELLRRAGVYRSIWDPGAKIHYNAGRQDFGHELLAELLATDETLYLRMEAEERNVIKREEATAAAVQTTKAADSGGV